MNDNAKKERLLSEKGRQLQNSIDRFQAQSRRETKKRATQEGNGEPSSPNSTNE